MSLFLAFALAAVPVPPAPPIAPPVARRIDRLLKATPLIDGHNDIAETLQDRLGPKLWQTDIRRDLGGFHTDIARLRTGRVSGQFWSVYVPTSLHGPAAVEATLRQIDVVRGLVRRYPGDLTLAETADDIVRIHRAGRIASLLGVEGGHQIDNSLPVLRTYYALGVRYMTLTHVENVDWADSANVPPSHGGLTGFGLKVVAEMNRLGMLVDLSHVSPAVMRQAIAASRAPVIFSHSSALALDAHPRNVPDDVLTLLKGRDGVVMVNFYPTFISDDYRLWAIAREAERKRIELEGMGRPTADLAAMLAEWQAAHPAPAVTVAQVADHIEHIAKIAGPEHVGIGGDFDGVDALPVGLEGVDRYPVLFAELIRRGWNDHDLAALAGGNLLRVLRKAEMVARALAGEPLADPQIAEVDAAAAR